MAVLALPTAIKPTASSVISIPIIWGDTVAIGNVVYLDAATSTYKLAACNAAAAAASANGIALTNGTAGDYGYVYKLLGSIILVGVTVVVGESYVVSATSGLLIPESGLVTGNYISRVATGSATNKLDLLPSITGIQRP